MIQQRDQVCFVSKSKHDDTKVSKTEKVILRSRFVNGLIRVLAVNENKQLTLNSLSETE